MFTQQFWVMTAVYGVAFGVLCALAAVRKNRDGFSWFFIGFFFGIFGLAALLILGKPARTPSPTAHETLVQCPFCAESIKPEATVCRYCGRDLPGPQIISDLPPDLTAGYEAWVRSRSDADYMKFLELLADAKGTLPTDATADRMALAFPLAAAKMDDFADYVEWLRA